MTGQTGISKAIIAAALVALAGCGGVDGADEFDALSGELQPAKAPSISASGDKADHACGVILREARMGISSTTGGAETDCSKGTCTLVWNALVDVSDQLVQQGAKAGIAYKPSSARSWGEVAGVPVDGAGLGFQRYRFRLFEGTPAANKNLSSTFKLQLAAFVRGADGKRVFDLNRAGSPVDTLQQSTAWQVQAAPTVCPAREGAKSSIDFALGWTQTQHGALVQGGQLTVNYDLNRLPQCIGNTYNGLQAWTTTAAVRFQPGGQQIEGPVKAAGSGYGSDWSSMPWTVTIPKNATGADVWFYTAGYQCGGTFYDSNMGRNYHFDVQPQSPAKPSWAGNFGGSFARDCAHRDGLSEPIVVDSYVLERACKFVDADVYVPGLTDGSEKPEQVLARVEWTDAAGKTQTAWLQYQGRVGNDYRYRWNMAYQLLATMAGDLKFTFQFSTDGLTWLKVGNADGSPRTVHKQ